MSERFTTSQIWGRTASRMGCIIWLLPVLLAACGGRESETVKPEKPATISREVVDAYILRTGTDPAKIESKRRDRLAVELAQLTAAAAIGESIPGASARAEITRLEALAHEAAEAAGVQAAPTDAALQQAYHAYAQTLPASEFHAAHILVANEPLAAAVIAELDGGEKFADVAAKRSADDSSSKGGDLGWIQPGHLPAEFFEALVRLKPGEYTRTPVHTAYGWHVIELLDTRFSAPPPFEEVKAQLAANLQQARYRKFLDDSLKPSKTAK